MSGVTNDLMWEKPSEVKLLTLEHKMAAKRMGFTDLFEKLYQGRYKDDFLRGEIPASHLFMQVICPILDAERAGDEVLVSDIIRSNSPLFDTKETVTMKLLKTVGSAYQDLRLCLLSQTTSIGDCIKAVIKSNLFSVSDILREAVCGAIKEDDDGVDETEAIERWRSVVGIPLGQFYSYYEYITDHSRFATHQGVKGLEYDRVLAVYDDYEARGKTFGFEKSLGAAELSDRDMQNMAEGKETTVDRTMRLIYVTCTRPKKSLALVVYTEAPEKVKKELLAKGWFKAEEVQEI